MIEKIGKIKFWANKYSYPDNPEFVSCKATLSTCGDTDERQLVISLGTKSDTVAIKRARKILQQWQANNAQLVPVKKLSDFEKR